MTTRNYLYLAQALSDPRLKTHHVFKVGYSTNPQDRIKTLGGSGSTVTYKTILVLELPSGVKDIHVLAHHKLDPFVVYRHTELQARYLAVFGPGHRPGLHRRREIVMFGPQYTLQRVKALFRRVVTGMYSPAGTYQCTEESCLSAGGVAYCGVCVKFMKSLVNTLTYQSGVSSRSDARKRCLDGADVLFSTVARQIHARKRHKWDGPIIGVFWVFRPTINLLATGRQFLVARVQSRNERKRTSRVQWWSCATTDIPDLRSKFTPETNIDTLSWDGGGWQCDIRTKQHAQFMRVVDIEKIAYYSRQWRISTPHIH
jgi:hypothetical protein